MIGPRDLLHIVTGKWGIRAISVLTLLVVWQFLGSMRLFNFFISSPTSVAQEFAGLLASGVLLADFAVSLQHLTIGFALAVVVGIPLGLVMGMFKKLEWAMGHYITALYVIPIAAWIPLIGIWFGFALFGKIAVVFVFTIVPLVMNTSSGVKNVDLRLVEAARSFGAKSTQLFYKVYLPGTFPFIYDGLRIGVGRGVKAMILAELLLFSGGLGGIIQEGEAFLNMPPIFVVIIFVVAFAIALVKFLEYVQRRLFAWKGVEQQFIEAGA